MSGVRDEENGSGLTSGRQGPTLAAVFSLAPVAAINCETSCFWPFVRGGITQTNPDRLLRQDVTTCAYFCSKAGPTVSARAPAWSYGDAGAGKEVDEAGQSSNPRGYRGRHGLEMARTNVKGGAWAARLTVEIGERK